VTTFLKLMQVLSQNRKLQHLNLSGNTLVDPNPSRVNDLNLNSVIPKKTKKKKDGPAAVKGAKGAKKPEPKDKKDKDKDKEKKKK